MKRALVIPRNCTDLPAASDTSVTHRISPFGDQLFDTWNNQAVFISREICETNPDYLQLIPYVTLVDFDEDFSLRVLSYRRPTKSTEQRLADRYSIGFGGHVEPDPNVVLSTSTEPYIQASDLPGFNLATAIRDAAVREVKEECDITIEPERLIPHAMIYDHTDAVGRVHYGIFYTYAMRDDDAIRPQNDEIEGMAIRLLDEVTDQLTLSWEKWSLHAASYLQNIPVGNVLPLGMLLELRQAIVARRDLLQTQQRKLQQRLSHVHANLHKRVRTNSIMWRGNVWQITPTDMYLADIMEVK